MRRYILFFIFVWAGLAAQSQDLLEYEYGTYWKGGESLPYRILYPLSFDSTRAYPVIVFLHGAYERGRDNESQLRIGGRYFLKEENRKKFPAIIIFPQCSNEYIWAEFETRLDSATGLAKKWYFPFRKKPSVPVQLLKELLDSLGAKPYVDKSRIYTGGLSQGGMGVFDLVARYPDMFAAAFPICGAGPVSTAKNFGKKVALWIFHGEKDEVVPTYFSRDYFKRLQKLGSDVKYTEYPGVHHDSWNNAFAEPELLTWLFSKSKN
jgi:predicted peptidase